MRRWMSGLLAMLMLLLCSASAELLCVSDGTQAALVTAQGETIVPFGSWREAFCVIAGQCYALGAETEGGVRYALCDETGRVFTDPVYAMLFASDGRILFNRDGRFGAMDAEGNELLPAEYSQLVTAGEGYLALTGAPNDNEADMILYIDGRGEAVSTGVRTAVGLTAFSDGRMPFRDPRTERYGYLDAQGEIAVEAKFETAGRFANGAAKASEDGKLGAIDANGEWLLRPEYDYLELGGAVSVGLIGRETFVILDGAFQEILRIEGASLEGALVGESPILMTGDAQTVFTAQGDILMEQNIQATVSPGLEGQLILADGDWGAACVSLVNPDGAQLERRDQHLLALGDGRYAFVHMNAVSYFSEALGEIRHSCDYDSLRYGMIDAEGREILPAEYLEIRALGQDRFLTIAQDGLRMIDGEGAVIWSHLKEDMHAAER